MNFLRLFWSWLRSSFVPFLKTRVLPIFRHRVFRVLVLLLGLGLSGYLYYLDVTIREAFDGRKFAVPARVYGRALEVYPGLKLTPAQLVEELRSVGYREHPRPDEDATYRYTLNGVEFTSREFAFWDGLQPTQRLRVDFADGVVALIQERGGEGKDIPLLRLEPPQIGGIYPGHNEDRDLLRLSQVPQTLIDALIAIEDRKFYTHWGIDPRGIARALYKTLSGQRIEGGSTLTQQLVKNFFLTSERTLTRKANEVLMAMLLELHYSKDEILETYLNEIYLGQDANRAIHGVGLASYFYFDRPLDRLELHEIATLVGMIKGPAIYDPRRKPEQALQRRNIVLQEMVKLEAISQEQFVLARQKPLGVAPRAPTGTSPYPAFLQYVHRQLQRDYREEDLRSEGLRIFTTLDPRIQRSAEQALSQRLEQIEKARKIPLNTLEGSVVVSSTQNGEVQAMVGGRQARYAGYNRALDAKRQIGSLAKPIVYLTALENPAKYTLLTPLDDSELVWRQRGSPDWKPKNYDNKFHGQVPLHTALARSLNVSTARLGIELGVDRILDKLPRFGIEQRPPAFPSSLLGAYELSPLEVTQMYQTFADGGFRTPLRAIRDIVTADGQPLQRYPLNVEAVAAAAPVYLLTTALQGVVKDGTGQGLNNWLPAELSVAGKTGTTDDLRDSWFAGYTGNHVAVVWVGRDDNKSSGLTGSNGALTVWGEMMKGLQPEALQPVVPEDIEFVAINPPAGASPEEACQTSGLLPFIKGSAPVGSASCDPSDRPLPGAQDAPAQDPSTQRSWFRRLFD
ncbi:MAG: penicillin-binding protein 1B [Hylemonella sp.]|uniref:penicillin-binding protein 1B n=1 Tax=Hylemonella sp. TaxID=2066020 RepID=UPI0022C7B8C2|nr:penicillin-binding protein 1B [Hylemonella sp.]MCZ8251386.1 penicillin-binding protein 1B [Hylemonella sp.]